MPGLKKLNTDSQLSTPYPTAAHHENVHGIAITLDAQKISYRDNLCSIVSLK
jgi:hypothetical protein